MFAAAESETMNKYIHEGQHLVFGTIEVRANYIVMW